MYVCVCACVSLFLCRGLCTVVAWCRWCSIMVSLHQLITDTQFLFWHGCLLSVCQPGCPLFSLAELHDCCFCCLAPIMWRGRSADGGLSRQHPYHTPYTQAWHGTAAFHLLSTWGGCSCYVGNEWCHSNNACSTGYVEQVYNTNGCLRIKIAITVKVLCTQFHRKCILPYLGTSQHDLEYVFHGMSKCRITSLSKNNPLSSQCVSCRSSGDFMVPEGKAANWVLLITSIKQPHKPPLMYWGRFTGLEEMYIQQQKNLYRAK